MRRFVLAAASNHLKCLHRSATPSLPSWASFTHHFSAFLLDIHIHIYMLRYTYYIVYTSDTYILSVLCFSLNVSIYISFLFVAHRLFTPAICLRHRLVASSIVHASPQRLRDQRQALHLLTIVLASFVWLYSKTLLSRCWKVHHVEIKFRYKCISSSSVVNSNCFHEPVIVWRQQLQRDSFISGCSYFSI